MKKIISIFTIIIVAVTLVSCDVKFGVKEVNESYEKEINEVVSLNDIDTIKIKVEIGEINIDTYDGEELKITGSLGKRSDKYSIYNKSGIIEFEAKSKSKLTLSNSDDTTKISVLVPNSYKSDFKIETGAGAADISNISAKKLEVDAGAGDIVIQNIKFDNLEYDAGVGSTKIRLNEAVGDIDISGGVGDILVELSEVGGDLTCDAGVGSTKIKIPENAPVKFNKQSGIGDCDINVTTSGEDKYTFKLSVGVGEIEVYN